MNGLEPVCAPANTPALNQLNFAPVEGSPPSVDSVQASAGVLCLWCGGKIPLKSHPYKKRVYDKKLCSEKCRGKFYYRQSHPIGTISCKYCGVKFKQSKTNHIFCSQSCAKTWNSVGVKFCTICNAPLIKMPGTPGPRKIKFCSEKCKLIGRNSVLRKNEPVRKKTNHARYHSLKDSVYLKLGGCCAGCGDKRTPCLSIDHVNGDGAEDRRNTRGTIAFLRKVLSDETGMYQILCMNCQWIKRHKNGEGKTRRPISETAG